MKYPWLAASIILIWAMAAFAILVRDEIRPDYVLGITIPSLPLSYSAFGDSALRNNLFTRSNSGDILHSHPEEWPSG
ncbi:MAG: hypothetical protein HYT22_03935 [Candidatus Niyogibacteria bacterium]|nr:hypothetical protein [Candidatus Niyogibacteria bacterium]